MQLPRSRVSHAFVRALLIVLSTTAVTAQSATLAPSSAVANDWFGCSVDLQGSLVVGGARNHDSGGLINSGAAYIFERVGQTWIERAQLNAADADSMDYFGSNVAIDGDTVLVGAEREGDAGADYGAAYVFVRNGAQWTQQAKLVAAQRVHDSLFGRSVALSGDTAVIGAVQDSSVNSLAGSVDIFVRTGATWTHQAHLADGTASYQAAFGYDVAIDGDTLLVGSAFDDAPLYNSGSVYAFTRAGAAWTSHGKFRPMTPVVDLRFGAALALEGDRAIIGTYALPGSAYVFEFGGGVWSEQALLHPIDPQPTAGFGLLVAMDGERVAIGALLESAGLAGSAGATYVFDRSGSNWTQTQHLISPMPATDDGFAFVALAGTTLAIGEYHDGASIGALHVFELGALASYCTAGTTTHGCTPHVWLDGTPSITGAAPARLTASGVEGQTFGLIFVGASANSTPWSSASTSLLCVMRPHARLTPGLATGGTTAQCDGELRADINAYVQTHASIVLGQSVVTGATLHAQAWFRDPPAPHFSNLSDALAFTFYP